MAPRKKATKPTAKAPAKPKKPRTTVKAASEEEPRKRGRPEGTSILQPDAATLEQIESLGRVQLSLREAGAFFGVSHETFRNFLDANKNAEEAFEKGKGDGRANIRRKQIQRALDDGDTTMLIWLGKQYLDQKDKSELAVGKPSDFSMSDYTDDELRKAAAGATARTRGTSETRTGATSPDRLH